MPIKKIIASGCSFTDVRFNDTWPYLLKEKYPNYDYDFLGLESSGNEIIQKRASNAVTLALKEYKPEEILVIAMWSTAERKTFFLDYYQAKELLDHWRRKDTEWNVSSQFANLRAQLTNPVQLFKHKPSLQHDIVLNASESEGWYNIHNINDTQFCKLYFKEIHNPNASLNTSVENMLFLNMFCERQNIKLINSIILNNQLEDIYNSNHEIVTYLLPEFKKIKFAEPVYDYLKKFNDRNLFREDGMHPNKEGHRIYLNNVLLPWIEKHYPGSFST